GPAAQRIAARALERRAQVRRDDDPGRGEIAVAAHHDVGASGKSLAHRLERLAPHHYGLAPGARAKAAHVRLEPPRQRVVAPDHAVFRDRGDEHDCDRASSLRYRHGTSPRFIVHTATFALMCGWGSYPSSAKSS